MQTICFDSVGGAAGDMILASLFDMGADPDAIAALLGNAGLTGFTLCAEKTNVHGFACTRCRVDIGKPEPEHCHRHLPDIIHIIDNLNVAARAKERARTVFTRLAEVEAAVHDMPVEKVHFHEVGAVDSIIDIVGVALALEMLGIDRIFCSPFRVGSGTVICAHGVLPVPVPATARLLEGWPVVKTDIDGELTTPTGAALLTGLSDGLWKGQHGQLIKTGCGAGSRELPRVPNMVRAFMFADSTPENESEQHREPIMVIETDIDDQSPETLAVLAEDLLKAGARDVTLQSVCMKKGRIGTRVTALTLPADTDRIAQMILCESSTIGVRICSAERIVLARRQVTIPTPWGDVDAKQVVRPDGTVDTIPELESCRRLATSSGVPLRHIMQVAGHASL